MNNNQKTLRDYSLTLLILSVLDVFIFVTDIIGGFVNKTFDAALLKVEPDLQTAVRVGIVIVAVVFFALIGAQVAIALKGMKIAENPTSEKGHITAAKVFFVVSVIGVISTVVTLFDSGKTVDVIDTVLTLANAVIDVCVFALFIKAAKAVRQSVLDLEK